MNSVVKNARRRPSHASVATAWMIGRVPVKRPKFDSIPQIATITLRGTPYFVAIAVSNSRWARCFSTAVRTKAFVSRRCTY